MSVEMISQENVYDGFFKMKKINFNQERFDGSVMENVTREVFIRNSVVFLSLYDPSEDKHLFVEQVRVGAILNDVHKPLVIEPIAGIIDDGESPLQAAIREAEEEAGIFLDTSSIQIVQQGYTSPGGSSEYAYFATGNFDSTKYKEQIGGVDGEQEDVRSHLITTQVALEMMSKGELNSLSGAFGLYWHIAQKSIMEFKNA